MNRLGSKQTPSITLLVVTCDKYTYVTQCKEKLAGEREHRLSIELGVPACSLVRDYIIHVHEAHQKKIKFAASDLSLDLEDSSTERLVPHSQVWLS
jgi:hypothetical protein